MLPRWIWSFSVKGVGISSEETDPILGFNQIQCGNTHGEGRVLGVSRPRPILRGGAPALPNIWDSPKNCAAREPRPLWWGVADA